MLAYIVKRLLQSTITMLGISVIIFALVNLIPGNPYASMIDLSMSPEQVDALLRQLGYYDPLTIKYLKWLGRMLQGDMGMSIFYKEPVAAIIVSRLGNTALLAVAAILIGSIIGIATGVFTSRHRKSLIDYLTTIFAFLGLSIPTFFFGMLLIKVFGVDLKWLPVSGKSSIGVTLSGIDYAWDVMKHLLMPAMVLGLMHAAALMRYTRSSMLEIQQQDYIRTARAKGLGERAVIYKHALKNALNPIITILSLKVPALLSGALLTETVFVWPGVGRLNYEAVLHRDYPLIMGIVMVLALFTLLSNLIADMLYAAVDPRIKYD